ncbi:MAG: DUF2807 domain-containing protein [Verrucomicrobia bacterium]|nr:DUF2807 domain-containing protein [Cytophagales bacterium]
MKKLFTMLALIIISLQTFAQEKQTRTVAVFDKVNIRSAITAFIRQGSSTSVEIETDVANKDKIITEVKNGELIIRRDDQWKDWWKNNDNNKIIAYITVKDLKSLRVSGASIAKGQTAFNTNGNFELEVSGASRLSLDLTAKQVNAEFSGASHCDIKLNASEADIEVSGASHLDISGKTDRQELEVSGASHFKGNDFVSKKATIEASGASHAEVAVSEDVVVNSSGASHVDYHGSPSRAVTNASGSSKVRKVQ